MTELPIQGILLRVLSALDAVPIPYMIMGGFAVRAVGMRDRNLGSVRQGQTRFR